MFYRPIVNSMYVNPEMGTVNSVEALYRYPQTFALARRYWPFSVDCVLDIGDETVAATYMRKAFRLPVLSTHGDLDSDAIWPCGHFMVVFCMEVLEHIWNPLSLLRRIKDTLSDDGILLLTTPSGFQMDWGPAHTVEHAYDRLLQLIHKSGFIVIEAVDIKIPVWWGLWHKRYGIRPAIRWVIRKLFFGPTHQLGSTRAYLLKKRSITCESAHT